MEDTWPALKEYHDCWPIRSMLKLALKYAAEASRRVQTRENAARIAGILRGVSPAA